MPNLNVESDKTSITTGSVTVAGSVTATDTGSENDRNPDDVCHIPQRCFITALALSGTIIAALPSAVILDCYRHVMKAPQNATSTSDDSDTCKSGERVAEKVPPISPGKFPWSQDVLDALHKTSEWSTVLGIVPAAIIGDKFGGRAILPICVLVLSTLHLLDTFYLNSTGGEYIFVCLTNVLGKIILMVQGATMFSMLSHWIPRREFGLTFGIFLFYVHVPEIVSKTFTDSIVVKTGSWAAPVYIFASFGFVWCTLWFIFGYSSYRDSILVSQGEFEYLEKELAPHLNFDKKRSPPLNMMVRSLPFWALVLAFVGTAINDVAFGKQFRNFMRMLHGEDPTEKYRLGVNLFVTFLTPVLGFCSDFLIKNSYVDVTLNRKIFTTFGSMGPALFMLAATFTKCKTRATIILFIAAKVLTSCYNIGIPLNTFDLAPNFTGFIFALHAAFDTVTAAIAPYAIEALKRNFALRRAYDYLFWLSFALITFSFIAFIMLASGEVQPWNNPEMAVKLEIEAREEAKRRKQHDEETKSL